MHPKNRTIGSIVFLRHLLRCRPSAPLWERSRVPTPHKGCPTCAGGLTAPQPWRHQQIKFSTTMTEKIVDTPRRRRAAPTGALLVPSALALLALVLLAGPALLETARQAATQLALPGWSRWHTGSPHPLQKQHPSTAQASGILLAEETEEPAGVQPEDAGQEQDRQQQQQQQAGVTTSPADWELLPDATFLAPVSGCMISPDGARSAPPCRPCSQALAGCACRACIASSSQPRVSCHCRSRDAGTTSRSRPAALPVQRDPRGGALQAGGLQPLPKRRAQVRRAPPAPLLVSLGCLLPWLLAHCAGCSCPAADCILELAVGGPPGESLSAAFCSMVEEQSTTRLFQRRACVCASLHLPHAACPPSSSPSPNSRASVAHCWFIAHPAC